MEILARGVGRRKEAVAQVQIVKGTGQFIINNIPAQQYLHNNTCSIISIKSPFNALNASALNSEIPNLISETAVKETTDDTKAIITNLETMDTIVKVKGGGLVGQAEAIKLGLARALCQLNPTMLPESFSGHSAAPDSETSELTADSSQLIVEEIRKQLKDKGYLTQDSRVKERRKYGLKKARKATQYNKR
jgi:small subunit ribosomal protein S9